MKHILIAALFGLLLIGCDKSNPVDEVTAGDALYGEEAMYKTTISTDDELARMNGNGPAHDLLRHGRMLGHLKTRLELTDTQFESVKVYAASMFEALKEIRTQVHDGLITRDEAHALVSEVRAQFVESVILILTEDQISKFERWIAEFWNKPHRRHGHGGPGGPGGNNRP